MTTRKPKPAPIVETIYRRNGPGGELHPIMRRVLPAPGKFAKGNRAAAKGDPRTVSLTIRIPTNTAEKLATLAYGRSSRADVVIGLIDEA